MELNLLSWYEGPVPHIQPQVRLYDGLMGFDTRVSWLKGQTLLVTDIPCPADFPRLTLDQAFGREGIWKTVKHINEIVVSPSIVLKPHSEWTEGDVQRAYMVNNHVLTDIGMIESHSKPVEEDQFDYQYEIPIIEVF